MQAGRQGGERAMQNAGWEGCSKGVAGNVKGGTLRWTAAKIYIRRSKQPTKGLLPLIFVITNTTL